MAFLGMRGTGDWVADARPKSYREGLLYLYPNGSVPLTAMMSKMGSEKVDDPQFHWWTKTLASQAGPITGIYSENTMTTPYVPGEGEAGDALYIKTSEATASEIRAGHQVLLRNNSDYRMDVNCLVQVVVLAGANSMTIVKLLQDDDFDLEAERIVIVGNANAEGAVMPASVSYDPVKWSNYTQIFRTPLEITRTAQLTKMRTGDAYKELKREAMEMHGIEMEKAFLFGIATEGTGLNGKPLRTTQGLIPSIKAGGTTDAYHLNTAYAGSSWVEKGEDWLDSKLEEIFRYGKMEKLVFAGNGAMLGIQKLIKSGSDYKLQPMTTSYGIKVIEWTTVFGTIYLKTHPLMNLEPSMRNSFVIFEPENLKYKFITDTTFYDDSEKKNTGHTRIDGVKEEFLTECGLEYHHPVGWGFLDGVGKDNGLTP